MNHADGSPPRFRLERGEDGFRVTAPALGLAARWREGLLSLVLVAGLTASLAGSFTQLTWAGGWAGVVSLVSGSFSDNGVRSAEFGDSPECR